jgi:hypothetical protein
MSTHVKMARQYVSACSITKEKENKLLYGRE